MPGLSLLPKLHLTPNGVRTFLILLFTMVLTGCTVADSFQGKMQDSGAGYQETLVANSDGTYLQTIACSNGNLVKKKGAWRFVADAGLGAAAEGSPNAPDVEITQEYVAANCCTQSDKVAQFDGDYPQSAFLPPAPPVQPDAQTQPSEQLGSGPPYAIATVDQQPDYQPLYITVAIVSVILWSWALIDIVRRQFDDVNTKIGWVVAIIVGGGIGGALYLTYGRQTGDIPGDYRD